MSADNYSKKKLLEDMGEESIEDWSLAKIKNRQAAHGATPSEDDWSRKQIFTDGVGISPTTTTSSTTTSTTASTSSSTSTTSTTASTSSTSSSTSTTSTTASTVSSTSSTSTTSTAP